MSRSGPYRGWLGIFLWQKRVEDAVCSTVNGQDAFCLIIFVLTGKFRCLPINSSLSDCWHLVFVSKVNQLFMPYSFVTIPYLFNKSMLDIEKNFRNIKFKNWKKYFLFSAAFFAKCFFLKTRILFFF